MQGKIALEEHFAVPESAGNPRGTYAEHTWAELKRRLREAVRLSPPPEGARADVVINPKRSLLKAGFSDLQKEVERAFQVVEKSARSVSQERA